MFTGKWVCVAATVTALVSAGCGASGDGSKAGAGASGVSAAASAAGGSGVGDFCTLDAKLVARKLHDLNSAFGSDAANQSQIVDDLLKDAPVTQSELIAAAPEAGKAAKSMAEAQAIAANGANSQFPSLTIQ